MSLLESLAAFFWEFLETVVVSLLIFAILYVFVFQPHQVKGNSMLPNFLDGEDLITSKLSYRFGEPQRGDVIIFKAPVSNNEYDYIKRIIGLPGDKIKIVNGYIFINDQKIDESDYLTDSLARPGYFLKEGDELAIPEGKYFVMGDNRQNSSDSRDFGPIERKSIVGKAWFIYWPPGKIGLIEKGQLNKLL